jgi:hypothetical protein
MQDLKAFGADDRLPCAACGKGWKQVARRNPLEGVPGGERQVLACTDCGDLYERLMGPDGAVIS